MLLRLISDGVEVLAEVLSAAGGPGRTPNFGNSNWKLTSLMLLFSGRPKVRALLVGIGVRVLVAVAVAVTRFLYSFSSTVILSTLERSSWFSLLAASEAFCNSSTLVSKSLRCLSLRSRNARCAALF